MSSPAQARAKRAPVSVRLGRPADVSAIVRLKDEQNRRDGTSYPVPRLFNEDGSLAKGIALILVAEEAGEVKQAVVFESKTVELTVFGTDPKATARMWRQIDFADYLLAQQGFEIIDCFVPPVVVRQIAKPLRRARFRQSALAKFFHEIGGSE